MKDLWHEQRERIELTVWYPPHEPREGDPHYHLFRAARQRLEDSGLLKCWVGNGQCDHTHPVELHHAEVEFAVQHGLDVARWIADHPQFGLKDEAGFAEWVESEGNLLPLCRYHHVGPGGVHVLPYPLWVVQKWWKTGEPVTVGMRRSDW